MEQEFRSYGVSVGPEVVDRMLDSVGSDLRELASAVSQLVADTDANVTPDAVQRYYQGQAEVTGFDIADLVLAGRQGEAVAAARRAIQLGVPLVLIASALSTAMRDVARVAGAGRIDPRRDASAFGMAPGSWRRRCGWPGSGPRRRCPGACSWSRSWMPGEGAAARPGVCGGGHGAAARGAHRPPLAPWA
ncbi:hypothetical protein [Corynebacterium urealyticum]|uniref:hypothetical protein n=1 Tax=Corynebacterium urealyticum TaxID=43771 RepID=UPI00293E10E8|nr:hypothetical protein [Corynebacterium urealyticum]WOH93905.1 hypothetical protein RZ943_07400 [Corynebacterium urealyticum]